VVFWLSYSVEDAGLIGGLFVVVWDEITGETVWQRYYSSVWLGRGDKFGWVGFAELHHCFGFSGSMVGLVGLWEYVHEVHYFCRFG
jgi:hypothetical protein